MVPLQISRSHIPIINDRSLKSPCPSLILVVKLIPLRRGAWWYILQGSHFIQIFSTDRLIRQHFEVSGRLYVI